MRKLVLGLLIGLIISMLAVSAQVTCTDPDEEDNPEDSLDTVAEVKYGITPKTDECVSDRDGYHKDPSAWVREYYCTTTTAGEGQTVVQRSHKDYECSRYGFDKCEGGKCVGGKASGSGTSVKKPVYEPPRCGDRVIQPDSEQCDPPDDICYLNEQIGICTRPVNGFGGCQCKLYKGGAAPAEAPQNVSEEPEAVVEEPEEAPEEAKEESAEEEREPLPTGEIEEPKGIGFTRSVSNAFKRFFSWIGSWFG